MNISSITFVLFFVFIFGQSIGGKMYSNVENVCRENSVVQTVEDLAVSENHSEDLNAFIDKFCSNKNFQLSRVKFPVGVRRYLSSEDCSEDSPNYDILENVCINEISMDKENWKHIERKLLTVYKPDAEGAFADWTEKTNNMAVFDIGWVESELVCRFKFEKINGEWFLTEYVDTTVYE